MGDPDKQSGPWDELDVPSQTDISPGLVTRLYYKFEPILKAAYGSWTNGDMKTAIEKETGNKGLILRGPAQVAKGQELVIAVDQSLCRALGVIYDFYPSDLSNATMRGQVENTETGQKGEAVLKYLPSLKPKTRDHIVISQGLASKVGIEDGKDIRITEITIDATDIDLDQV